MGRTARGALPVTKRCTADSDQLAWGHLISFHSLRGADAPRGGRRAHGRSVRCEHVDHLPFECEPHAIGLGQRRGVEAHEQAAGHASLSDARARALRDSATPSAVRRRRRWR